jgi:hypothetical protein
MPHAPDNESNEQLKKFIGSAQQFGLKAKLERKRDEQLRRTNFCSSHQPDKIDNFNPVVSPKPPWWDNSCISP